MNTSEKIVKFLKRRKSPATAKMIAEKTKSSHKTVRNVLPRLEEYGDVVAEYMIDPVNGREVLGYQV